MHFQMFNRVYGRVWALPTLDACKAVIASRQSGECRFEVTTNVPDMSGIEVAAFDSWEMPDVYEIHTVL